MPRPLSFDPELKLQQGAMLFWQQGFHETSINDLTSRLELNKFSLYKQFGNKEAFYLKSLNWYHQHIYQPLLQPLRSDQGKASINHYFLNLSKELSRKGGSAGCLINNTLNWEQDMPQESRQAAKQMVSELRQLLIRNFEQAQTQGKLTMPANECVNFTLMTIQGLINTRRSLGPLVMQNNLRFFLRQLERW